MRNFVGRDKNIESHAKNITRLVLKNTRPVITSTCISATSGVVK